MSNYDELTTEELADHVEKYRRKARQSASPGTHRVYEEAKAELETRDDHDDTSSMDNVSTETLSDHVDRRRRDANQSSSPGKQRVYEQLEEELEGRDDYNPNDDGTFADFSDDELSDVHSQYEAAADEYGGPWEDTLAELESEMAARGQTASTVAELSAGSGELTDDRIEEAAIGPDGSIRAPQMDEVAELSSARVDRLIDFYDGLIDRLGANYTGAWHRDDDGIYSEMGGRVAKAKEIKSELESRR